MRKDNETENSVWIKYANQLNSSQISRKQALKDLTRRKKKKTSRN